MRNRRFLLVVTAVLGVLLVSSSLVPDPDQAPKPALPARGAEPGAQVVEGRLPDDRVVRAEVGDLLQLEVTAPVPTGVEIQSFGELETAAPDAPARFTLLAERRGRFAVRYVGTGRTAGFVEVG